MNRNPFLADVRANGFWRGTRSRPPRNHALPELTRCQQAIGRPSRPGSAVAGRGTRIFLEYQKSSQSPTLQGD